MEKVIIIGAGQAGLATAYYLQRGGINPLLLDMQVSAGGSWNQVWETMPLFSDASFSSLPGKQMPAKEGKLYPDDVVDYFHAYEQRYEFRIERPVRVDKVHITDTGFRITTDDKTYHAEHVVMATGIQTSPYVPSVKGQILGQYWHTANYPGAQTFRGKRVAVVGAGNSGAQIVAELSQVAEVRWLVREEPQFMPDWMTGTELFRRAHHNALKQLRGEETENPFAEYGNIVMVDSVKKAREENRLSFEPMPDSLDELDVDHLIWATGFRPALRPVRAHLDGENQPTVAGLHLVGYGDWTGIGSATIMGVGPFAKKTAQAIIESYNGA